jgi:hypothetical protein
MIVAQIILTVLLAALLVASAWLIFAKAGQPGWAALVPVYREWLLVKIVGKPVLWFLLLMIPGVNAIIALLIVFNLATVFGKGGGFGAGMLFLPFIFYPILGFGDAKYLGPPRRRKSPRSRPRFEDDNVEDDDRGTRRGRRPVDDDEDDRDRGVRRGRKQADSGSRRHPDEDY